jgi:RNA polymerase sigma factor (TIGR02999 family)
MNAEASPNRGEVTQLLVAIRDGEREALDRLLPLVYEELRRMAQRQLGRERADHTLHATALVHEAYLKLAGGSLNAVDRSHFLAISARAMRQVLVEYARRRNAEKRGGGWERTTLNDGDNAVEFSPDELLSLDAALSELEPRQREVVEYRFFGGMDEQEVATVMGISDRTVRRDWVKARAWLYKKLYQESDA